MCRASLGERVATEHLERIAIAAREAGTTVTVDAEDHRTTDASLRMATALRERLGSVGSVVQAALRRTETDVRELAAPGSGYGSARAPTPSRPRRRSPPSMTSTGRSRAACGP